MKVRSIHLTQSDPCQENWGNMTITEKGRHCERCQKEVIDFSVMSDNQIFEFFSNYKGKERICGNFLPHQLNKQIYNQTMTASSPWRKIGVLAASFLLAIPVVGQRQLQGLNRDKTTISDSFQDSEKSGSARLVEGVVQNEFGEALIGANILIENTSRGTTTNEQGRFSIRMENTQASLVISYIGYHSQKISTLGKDLGAVRVELSQNALLPEVVVKGHSYQRSDNSTRTGTLITRTIEQPPRLIKKRNLRFAAPPKTEIKIYPNPFVSQVQIELDKLRAGDFTLKIIANTGQIVHQIKLSLSSHQRLEMDLAALNLPSGTYWLQISDGKGQDFKQQLIKIDR